MIIEALRHSSKVGNASGNCETSHGMSHQLHRDLEITLLGSSTTRHGTDVSLRIPLVGDEKWRHSAKWAT